MIKNDFLKHIAETGYNVGFGAKKHFATYDIVEKIPGIISFLSMAIGIFALIISDLSSEYIAASLIVFGIIGLYISFYNTQKEKYAKSGKELTKLFNDLKVIYLNVKNTPDDSDMSIFQEDFKQVESQYYDKCISKQIIFSNWYAHYKFFWEHQIEWIDEQKNFRFFRDKIPLSFSIFLTLLFITLTFNFYELTKVACELIVEVKS